jgi:hypothetical protein
MRVADLLAVCFVNPFNMLDGSDGLAAGVSGIIAFGFIFIAPPHLDKPRSFALLDEFEGSESFGDVEAVTHRCPPRNLVLGSGRSLTTK